MFYEMRRKDRILSEDDAKKILSEGEYGVLSTIGENGYPYGVPVSYAYTDGAIYFHCAAGKGHKLANIAFNSHVSFTVIVDTEVVPEGLTTRYRSAIVFGKAEKTDGEEKKKALMALVKKYSPDFMDRGQKSMDTSFNVTDVYKIVPDHISGKVNKANK